MWSTHHRLKHMLKAHQKTVDRSLVVKVRPIVEIDVKLIVKRIDLDRQIESRNRTVQLQMRHLHTRQLHLFQRKILQNKHRLEQWRILRIAIALRGTH